jgi:hypothetical protein
MTLEFKPNVFLHADNGDRAVQLASLTPTELQLGDSCSAGGPESRIIAFTSEGHRVCKSANVHNCAMCIGNGSAKSVNCQSPVKQ